MSVVIVTKNTYIKAREIFHMTMDENIGTIEMITNGRRQDVPYANYIINIFYAPETGHSHNQHGQNEDRHMSITLLQKADAYGTFKEILTQIREQCPDVKWLNEAFEKMIKGEVKDEGNGYRLGGQRLPHLQVTLKGQVKDGTKRKAKKVSSTRKKKRRS